MKKIKTNHVFIGDFETTVYDGQEYTEVWASALVQLGSEDVKIFHSIADTWDYLSSLRKDCIVYYHNLKFDGTFWLSYFFGVKGYQQAFDGYDEFLSDMKGMGEVHSPHSVSNKDMQNKTVKYLISDMGQWYSITVKIGGHIIEFRDSLKLLPFSVKAIGKSFKTKHQKLDMEYKGFRYAGCEITEEERKYIANDVLVIKEALEIMFSQGHDKITIGSCCMKEYRKSITQDEYKIMFPDVYEQAIDEDLYDAPSVGEYVKKSYRGGWCYLVKGKEQKMYSKGITADVNSLYPSVMHSESGSWYPVGEGHMWKGNEIPYDDFPKNVYWFVRIRTRFYLKKGKLPFIQLKNSIRYVGTEMLETSDVIDRDGNHHLFFENVDGKMYDTRVTLTMTMTDYILFREHYNVVQFEILDGCWFRADYGIFDTYINKWREIKMNSTGAMRQLAKLFLNNLYGKMASSQNSSFKVGVVRPDGSIGFLNAIENEKKPGYIPVGSAITSYARNFTIRAAQKNYHGVDKPGFIYADTDSIHCDLSPEELVDVPVHPTAFCHWKLESTWDMGWFVRQKTYIEHVIAEDLEPVDKPYYSVKCAGMPDRCKELFMHSVNGTEPEDVSQLTDEELEFIHTKRTLEDFNRGLIVPGKLMPKRIRGGTILIDTYYEMR